MTYSKIQIPFLDRLNVGYNIEEMNHGSDS